MKRRGSRRDGGGVRVPTACATAASNSATLGPIVSWPVRDDPRDGVELVCSDVRPREPDRVAHLAPFSRYHAIVRSRPSSSSTFAAKPRSSRALSTFGIRSSTSL